MCVCVCVCEQLALVGLHVVQMTELHESMCVRMFTYTNANIHTTCIPPYMHTYILDTDPFVRQ